VIRLHGTLRDDDVSVFVHRIRYQEFQFASLVTARAKPGAVIALDVNPGTTKVLTQSWQKLKWRRQVCERNSRESGKQHIV
jgi:hypothetical protein